MAATLLLIALIAPVAQALLAALITRPAGLRDVIVVISALTQAGAAFGLVHAASLGETARIVLTEPLPGVDLAFAADPLGLLFGAFVSALGALNGLYAIGFLRASKTPAPWRTQALIAFAMAATMGVAYAANLLTFFLYSEALTIAAFALIALSGAERARRAALLILATLTTASFALLLPAIVWTTAIAGGQDFKPGGLLPANLDPVIANALFLMFMLGQAKTALMPMHVLATSAATAPAPIAATLTAICALSVGGFAAVRVALNVFGPALAQADIARLIIAALAGASAVVGALIAVGRIDLRERIGYLAVSQSALVVLAVALAAPVGVSGSSSGWFAAIMQIAANALALLTITLSLGAATLATSRMQAADMDGLGRVMPWVFAAFACGAISLIGAPPLAGAWSKLWLFATAGEAGAYWAMAVIGAASLLTLAALAPMTARALTEPAPTDPFTRTDSTPALAFAAVVLAGLATASLVLFVDLLARFLAPVWEVAL